MLNYAYLWKEIVFKVAAGNEWVSMFLLITILALQKWFTKNAVIKRKAASMLHSSLSKMQFGRQNKKFHVQEGKDRG